MTEILGKKVTVTVDRPMGSRHPQYPHMVYPVNYGYVAGIAAGDGEAQDAYLLGIHVPVTTLTGRLIAIIHRRDDCEDKWVVVPEGMTLTSDEIMDAVWFQEQYFETEIWM